MSTPNNNELNTNVTIVSEKYVQVSESRIKNTIKEFKKGLPFTGLISFSLSGMISFLIAFVSDLNNDVWKWIFLSLFCICALIFIIFGTITLARLKKGKGTEKWFMEEIKGDGHYEIEKISINSKLIFNIINFILIVGIPIAILLLVLGLNNWKISNKDWAIMFWVLWIIGSLCSLMFGTYINALFAYLFFGYEDGIPDISIF